MGRQRRPVPRLLAGKLKRIRVEMGIGQAEMARRLARAPSPPDGAMISRYERGEREPNLFVILAYARLADIPVDLLLDDALAVREVAWAMSPEVKKK